MRETPLAPRSLYGAPNPYPAASYAEAAILCEPECSHFHPLVDPECYALHRAASHLHKRDLKAFATVARELSSRRNHQLTSKEELLRAGRALSQIIEHKVLPTLSIEAQVAFIQAQAERTWRKGLLEAA